MPYWLKQILPALAILLLIAAITGVSAYNSMPSYPYGRSHCCSKALTIALLEYAEAHGGKYPTGEATPEASLSLLYREKLATPNLLRGKIVPLETVEAVLSRGELLGPDTCGWHYVEGLSRRDDSRIAIVWDKVGLGHNGEALRGGGHTVLFVNLDERVIPEAEWPAFLAEQERLLAARKSR